MRWVCLGGAGGGGEPVFLHFSPFTSRESRRSHFMAVIRQRGASETAVSFKSKLGGVGVILNY